MRALTITHSELYSRVAGLQMWMVEGCFEFIALVVPHWPRDVRGAFVSVFSVPQNLDSAQLVTSAKATHWVST
eukprot:6092605-Amphidinium_carterae.1